MGIVIWNKLKRDGLMKKLPYLIVIVIILAGFACSKKPESVVNNGEQTQTQPQPQPQATSEKSAEGKFFGAKETEYPKWFKQSFMDLGDDVKEAASANKRLVIFFQQNGCPYCNALVERNFAQKDILEKSQKHFDILAINMWGDREITDVDGKQYTEKTFAEHHKIQFTPTLLFYDEAGQVILRLNGYRSPARFTVDLDYVALKKEKESKYRDFIKANYTPGQSSKVMHSEDFFAKDVQDLSKPKKVFAVFFEQKDCPNCDRLHKKILPDAGTRKVIAQFDNYQLDMWSKEMITTPDGRKLSVRDWAKELDIKFAPSILIFNEEGKEIIRSEAFFKVFHTQGIFAYVLEGAYKKEPSFQRYLSERADHFREKGDNVDIWRMADEAKEERPL